MGVRVGDWIAMERTIAGVSLSGRDVVKRLPHSVPKSGCGA